jgi:hypothetical protein
MDPAPIAQAEPHFSWLRELVVPAFFTVVGAAVGFVASQIRDEWLAKRSKKSFLIAIRIELDSLNDQFTGSLTGVRDSAQKISGGGGPAPSFATAWRRAVFTTQVGKLRDVADTLLIEIIHFYSDLASVDSLVEKVNEVSGDFNRANVASGERDFLRGRVVAALKVLEEKLSSVGKRLETLRHKLPPSKP